NESNLPIKKFVVESDARIALEGAFSGKPGSILIAGTGSIMFGKDSRGNIHRVGGFGRILGDEGSGFHIGRSGLTAVAKQFDGRGETTKLMTLLKEKFNIANSKELILAVYKNNFDIPTVAPLVIQAAEDGDLVCKKIIQTEVDELLLHIKSMKRLLNEEELKISLIGGTITTNNFYARLFKKKVNNIDRVKISEPELEPAVGAALLAKGSLETEI
ncbi:N-acetylglucosamine kinase of eukaryotic type, partial [hydrothermal vent metagenome]